jgi:hypothetical protein
MSGGRLGIWTMVAALTWLVAGCAPTNPDAPPQQAQNPTARLRRLTAKTLAIADSPQIV